MSSKNNKSKSIAVFLQARISSKRLPGKIFRELNGKSIIQHIIERVGKLKKIYNYLVVLTPFSDIEVLQAHLKTYAEVIIFAGDENNVLKRFALANKKINADVIIRITGDNPLVDIHHLRRGLYLHMRNNSDYTCYDNLALGTGFEIFNGDVLEKCYKNAGSPYQMEHVTPYIKEHTDKFKLQILKVRGLFNQPGLRLTVDEEKDFKLMSVIYENLYKGKPIDVRQVIRFLQQNPETIRINADVKQKKI
ncbi:MAG: hypothetical protein KKH98_12905 [Spirochaetes bacterium]|nr:hypothetical protein [Spirochaetota bacterium]